MGPQNAVIGESYGTELPETQVDANTLVEEKKRAKFSRTAEFKELKEYIESRISFYQVMLPNGNEIGINADPTTEDWKVANRVIGEFRAIINVYEASQEAVADATKKLNT